MRTICALVVCVMMGASVRADPGDAARGHYKRGLWLYNEGKFEAARVEFEAGHQLQPLPLFLFNAAQAARRGGDPQRALDLYRRFVAADPASSQRAEADQHIAALEARVGPPTVTPPPAPAAAIVAAPPMRSWSRDPAGGALIGLGAAAAVAGVALLSIGGARLATQDSYDSFDAAKGARPLMIAGGVSAGVAALLLIGGGVRYGVLARRLSRVQLAIGPSSVGLVTAVPW